MNNLYLVRHGHTVWTDSGGIAGRSDIALSEVGIDAILRLAKSFPADAAMTHWFCSPLQRTRTSSALLREIMARTSLTALPAEVFDQRIVELDFGEWEGMTWDQVHAQHGDILQAWGEDWVNRSPPGGETFQRQVDRCSAWLEDLLLETRSDTDASAVVVSHGGSIRALLCTCLGWPLTRAMEFSVDPASLCWLTRQTPLDEWCVRMINSQFA